MQISLATSPEFIDRLHPDDALLARELEERGHRVSSLEWGSEAVGDAVVLRTTWDYYRRLDEFLAWTKRVDELATLLNSSEVVAWNSNKFYLQELAQRGVRIPDTHFVRELDDLDQWAPGAGRWVVKPDVSANAWETISTEDATEAREQARRILELERRPLIQPYLPDIENGEFSVIFFDGVYSHTVFKSPKSGDFRVQHDHGGRVEARTPPGPVLQAAERAVEAIPFETLAYARCDLVSTPDGPAVMELELIEPELFTRFAEGSAARFADAIERHMEIR